MALSLTPQEERAKLLNKFYESQSIFQLKDLILEMEKITGIIDQGLVRKRLQELVDDGELRTGRIGGCVYYWSLASYNFVETKHALEACEALNEDLDKQLEKAAKQLEDAEEASKLDDEAKLIEREIDMLKIQKADLEKKIADSKADVDFEAVTKKAANIKRIREAANRWTDNICTIKMWCRNSFNRTEDELNNYFHIPEDLSYFDLDK